MRGGFFICKYKSGAKEVAEAKMSHHGNRGASELNALRCCRASVCTLIRVLVTLGSLAIYQVLDRGAGPAPRVVLQ